jgi:hypothetical protein
MVMLGDTYLNSPYLTIQSILRHRRAGGNQTSNPSQASATNVGKGYSARFGMNSVYSGGTQVTVIHFNFRTETAY